MKKMIIMGLISVSSAALLAGCGSSNDDDTDTDTGLTGDKYSGGLVWENYTKTDAGGSGALPTGANSADFVRCKACHGWDALGAEGGYVRRSAKTTRPNPTTGTNLSGKMGTASITAAEVLHSGGRAFSTEDKTMPDYSADGGLNAQQTADVVAFLNQGDNITDFADLNITENPVAYTFNTATSAATGEGLYTTNCSGCHGTDGMNPVVGGGLGGYFAQDGKYSEGFHKMVYGIADTTMTRAAAGTLSGQEAADILAYIQANMVPDQYKGGLVWENYTKTSAGGSGALPTGATNSDFVRCKACHGWDGKGLEGGYVRRSASATRPNPVAGGDLTTQMAASSVTWSAVEHASGRAFNVEDLTMPNYTAAGGLTATQVVDVVGFLNSGPKVTDFATLDIIANPVAYTFSGTSATDGATLYADNCAGCHGTDGMNAVVAGGLGAYFVKDGKYSEGFHKMVYGIANTSMTRASAGSLSGQEAADILTYIQSEIGSTF